MLSEIVKYETIIFSLTDVLVFSNAEPSVFWGFAKDLGISAEDLLMLRNSCEQELRSRENCIVSLGNIYSLIHDIQPGWDTDLLMKSEEAERTGNSSVNPVVEAIFSESVKIGKRVYVVDDTPLPVHDVASILEKCGLNAYDGVVVSSDIPGSTCYEHILKKVLEESSSQPENCIFIGKSAECDIARAMKMTAAVYKTPAEMYAEERDEVGELSVEEINRRYSSAEQPSDEVVISVDNAAIMFNMSSERVDNIKEYIIKLVKHQLNFKEFWALKGVSFTVKRGERVGLIGTNGSGKSTMLKIISGVMRCTKGAVSVKGSIAPMIELGAGFDMELSARENVFLNGAILGYSREDMSDRYDDIISFAELEDFQDVAIKNYSSGMIARLGFAIATSHIPDILIIDEILSVGDYSFQNKCKERIKTMTDSGATVLLVSHSSSDIINMCDRAIWLNKGELCADGEAQYIVEKYINR